MKKNYLLLLAAFMSIGLYINTSAQVAPSYLSGNGVKAHGIPKTLGTIPNQLHSSGSSVTDSYWENDAFANDSALGGSPSTGADIFTLQAYPLFPDTQGVFTFSNGDFATIIQLCGNVLDPYAYNMQNFWAGSSWGQFNSYTVDSMAVGRLYTRVVPDNGMVDTMVVYLYSDADTSVGDYYFVNAGKFELNYFTQGQDTLKDTLLWKEMQYNHLTNGPKTLNAGLMQTIKIPLTIADTGFTTASFSTNGFMVPAGFHVTSAVGFIPGYSYSLGDNIDNTANAFRIAYFQEHSDGSCPDYFGFGGITSGGIKDWNVSEVATYLERYNLPSNSGWNGFMRPVWDFLCPNDPSGNGWSLEEWDIYYKVTSTYNVGIPTISETGTKLYQNQPNPSNNSTVIGYETKSAGPVMLEIRDITGRVVMEFNQGNQASGKYNVIVDVTKLSQGIYTYTLKTSQESLTRRMVIAK